MEPTVTVDEELSRNLMEACSRFSRSVSGSFHKGPGSEGRPAQFFVMHHIMKAGPDAAAGVRVSDIAASVGVTASSITQIVTDLEGRGLVQRSMDPQDRRVVRVSLTPGGHDLLEAAKRPYIQRMAGLARYLGPSKAALLLGLLTEAESYLHAEATAPAESGPSQAGRTPKETAPR